MGSIAPSVTHTAFRVSPDSCLLGNEDTERSIYRYDSISFPKTTKNSQMDQSLQQLTSWCVVILRLRRSLDGNPGRTRIHPDYLVFLGHALLFLCADAFMNDCLPLDHHKWSSKIQLIYFLPNVLD